MNQYPFITVVMPVRNEGRFIARTINQLLEQDYPEDCSEIIVADGMSADNTCDIVKRIAADNPKVVLLANSKKLASAGRNLGFKNGRGDIFLVVDGHCYIPTKQFFQNIVSCFKKSGAQCLGRPQPLDPPGTTTFQKAVALARNSLIGHAGDSLIYSDYEGLVSPVSHGAVYKKEVFERVGYVDETFDAAEDVEFNYRLAKAGIRTYMSPSLSVKYYPRETLKGLFNQLRRYGRGRVKLLKKHPETFSLVSLAPLFLVLGVVLIPFFSPVPIIAYGGYFAIIIFYSLMISLRYGMALIFLLPLIYLTIHFGMGWGLLAGFLRKA